MSFTSFKQYRFIKYEKCIIFIYLNLCIYFKSQKFMVLSFRPAFFHKPPLFIIILVSHTSTTNTPSPTHCTELLLSLLGAHSPNPPISSSPPPTSAFNQLSLAASASLGFQCPTHIDPFRRGLIPNGADYRSSLYKKHCFVAYTPSFLFVSWQWKMVGFNG